jgi:DNA-binding transcriptional MocR family regulator
VLIPIERRGGKPVFRQIVDHLRRGIESGRLGPGERLPPIRELARDLGVNRETVAAAYRELEARGLTESGVGRGTFVLGQASAATAAPAEDARPAPERPFHPVLSRTVAALAALPAVDYSAGASAVRLERVPGCPSHYPAEEFRRALAHVMRREGRALLEYGDPRGHEGLREVLAERLARAGIEADPDEIVLTGGSTQGLAIAARLFCDPGDAVVVEAPTYPGTFATLLAAGLRLAPVPLGADGLDLDALEAVLARGDVRLVYTMPTFQNPTGISTTLEHRRRLLAITARHGVPVVEDDFEKDLWIRGRVAPPLKALDRTGNVVYLGTFSKALFPGARVGWLVGGRRVGEAAVALKRSLDLASSPVLQAGLAHFCRSGAYDRHVRRLARELGRRLEAAEEALAAHLPEGSTFTRPQGGFVLWVTLPAALDTLTLLPAARAAGVVYSPGQIFFTDQRRSSALRLSLAQADAAEIARGVRILGEVARAALVRSAAARVAGEGPRIHV